MRRVGKLIRGLCAGVVATVALLVVAMPGAALGATTTTITFDDLSPGAMVSTQYDAQGVDFVRGIVGSNVYCYPVIVAVAQGAAQSGNHVADATCANGEIFDSSIRGNLKNSAKHVSVYAGFSPTGSGSLASEAVTLTAYDALGSVVNTTTATVGAGQGTHTLLAVSSSSANIVAFDVTGTSANVSIDDVTFDNPGGVPADFAISPNSTFIQVTQGSAVADLVTIQRLNGSFGGVTFKASGLPAGIHVSFSPNPATGNSTTMTVSADRGAPLPQPGPFPSFTVTGTPAGAGVGSRPRSATVIVVVDPLFTVDTPSTVSVPPCSTLRVPISVSAVPGFTGTVTLTANGVPSDDQASFDPATLALPAQTHTTLTLTSGSDTSGPLGDVTVTASSGGAADPSGVIRVSRVAPSITSLTDSSGTPLHGGETPQGASPELGTLVIVHGHGFCPGSTVYFGNALASAVTQGPFTDGLGPYGDETVLRTAVPSLGTSGNVYVVRQGERPSSPGTAAAPFSVDSYRDVNGFSFENNDSFQSDVGGYTFSDVSEVFGDAATHISVNPCWPFGDCSIVTPVPDPFALLFGAIANLALQDGQCFGFSLASQRLLHGDQIFPAFPFQPGVAEAAVWNLLGPDPANGSSGASAQIAHFIHLMHLEQFSAEALHFWWVKATTNALIGSQGSIMDDVISALHAGDHPLVELRNGSEGHVVVAYGVDQANDSNLVGNGDRVIDVYDPNQEFTNGENTPNGTTHQAVLSTSEIVVHSDGHWEFPGFTPEWHGGPGSLVVMPYGVVPVQPTLPTSISGLVDLLSGSARATQVTDSGGRTLLRSDGSINTGPTGIPDAAQFATLSGSTRPGPDIFLFGRRGTYTTTVQGSASGSYHDALFAHGLAASISAAATPAVKDSLSVPASLDGLRFGQTSPAAASTPRQAHIEIVVTGSQKSERTATVATTVPVKGQAAIMFNAAHDAVEVTAGNQPTSYTLSLSWAGPHGFPQTFAAPTVHLAAGDRATFTPANWSTLQASAATLRLTRPNGKTTTRTIQNRLRPADRYTVSLKVAKFGATRRLTIISRFIRLTPGSTALINWQVRRGRTLVARRTASLTGRRLRRGLTSLTFPVRGLKSRGYTFRASVELLSPAHGGMYLSQQIGRTRRFRG